MEKPYTEIDAADFISIYVSLALKQLGDGVVGLENFNRYYIPKLKRSKCLDLLQDEGVSRKHGSTD